MEIRSTGKEAWHIKEVSEIAALVSREAKEGDVICVMSNGSFDGIQGLLLEALARRP
jgi:UDP-N-acetylmuramate-alanine ligase